MDHLVRMEAGLGYCMYMDVGSILPSFYGKHSVHGSILGFVSCSFLVVLGPVIWVEYVANECLPLDKKRDPGGRKLRMILVMYFLF